MFDQEDIIGFTEITKVVQMYLLPVAGIFILIAFAIQGYAEYLEKEELKVEYEAYDLFTATLRKLIFPIAFFLTFNWVCLIPIYLVSELETTFKKVDIVEKMYASKLTKWENLLISNGYLTDDNMDSWKNASMQSKLSVIRLVKHKAEIEGIMKSDAEIANKLESTLSQESEISLWDIVTEMSFMDSIHFLIVLLINELRQGIEFLFGLIFKFLLYLDILLGQFVALFAIIPIFRHNILNWLKENLSLCFWALVFVFINWIVGYISFKSQLSSASSVADWVIPVLSILTYGAIGTIAGKVIGKEASGGGMLRMATTTAMNAIPAVGSIAAAAMTNVHSIATTSQAGKAFGGMIYDAMKGGRMSGITEASTGVLRGAKNTMDFFKPQSMPSPMERLADDMAALRKGMID